MATSQSAHLGWFQPSPVPDVATAQTIRLMSECIRRSASDPLIQAAAWDAVKRFGNDPMRTGGAADLARAIWWYCRYTVERLRHQEFKALVAAFPEKKQLIVDPVELLRMNPPAGDCSAFSMLVCAFLKCLGIRCELVTVAVSPAEPDVYTHVYPRAILEDGVRMPLDAHAGDAPGWEVPPGDVFRRQIWDASGSPVWDSAQAPSKLHEYVRMGLGDDSSTDLSSSFSEIAGSANATYTDANANTSSSGSSSGSTGSSSGVVSFLENLANQWTQIGAKVVAPTTTVTQTKSGYTVSTPAGTSTNAVSSLTGVSSSTWIWIGVLGVGAVVLVKVLGKSKER